jgi:inner membrane protein
VDPLTHGLLGAATARVVVARPAGSSCWLAAVAGALLPDVDALIRSGADPLLYAEFHRHFTHALAFIPVGGALAALPWLLAPLTRPQWKAHLGAATAGYATHGVLDASTTYGTLLFWPFADTRVGWNVISIVDPLFTLVLLLGVALAIWRATRMPAATALLVCVAYLATGAVQRDRALDAQGRIAAARGHDRARGAVFPGFGNNLVWRSLYRAGDTLYMDRIRVPWSGTASWSPGPQVRILRQQDLPPEVLADARLRRDFARFERFADGWVARAPGEPDLIGDARYSSAADRFEPVWGIRVTPASVDAPIEWVDRSRQRRVDVSALWTELRGADPRYHPIAPAR